MESKETAEAANHTSMQGQDDAVREKNFDANIAESKENPSEQASTTLGDLENADDDPKTGETEAEDESQYVTGVKLVTLVLALCMAVFLVALDQTIIATAIPKITDRFNSISDIGWYGSAYFLTSTSLQPSFGRIYKVFNVSLPAGKIS